MVLGVNMKFFTRAVLLGVLSGLVLLGARAAEQKGEDLPSAKTILERYAKAIGGKEAFKKHSSQHVIGTVEMPAQKIKGKLEVFAQRPNNLLMKVSMPALGDVTTGYTGDVAWISTAITGPMLLDGLKAQEAATQADFDHFLHDPADYKVMEVLGREQFDGEDCYKVKLVHQTGFESVDYFSVKSGLQRGFIATQETPFGSIKATTIVSDYKKFGDVYMPARSVQKASGIESVQTISSVEYDKVDPSVFALPPEVKTLLEQKKKAAEEEKKEEK
jgi:hypothetical protein